MPLDVTNAESAYLMATARHKAWLARFMQQWTRPLQDAVMVRMWDTLPPQIKARAKEGNPGMFAEVEKRITALKEQGR